MRVLFLAATAPGRLVRLLLSPPEMSQPLPDFSQPPAHGTTQGNGTGPGAPGAAAPPGQAEAAAGTKGGKGGKGGGTAAASAGESGGGGGGGGSCGDAVVAEVTHGVWGAVVNFERVGGKKEATGAGARGPWVYGFVCGYGCLRTMGSY